MNALTHQWKWDFRRIRLFWILWLALLALAFVLRFQALVHYNPRSPFPALTAALLPIVLFVFGALLVARVMFITPLAGSTAHWKTRPLSRRSLFWEKTLLILLLIWLPAMIGVVTFNVALVADPVFLASTSFYYGTSALAVFFLTAFLASLCARITTFIGSIAGAIGLVAALGMIVQLLRARFRFSPIVDLGPATLSPWESTGHTMMTALGILLLTALAAWLLSALKRRPEAAIAIAATGIVVLMTATSLWRVYFGPLDASPHKDLLIEVLDKDQELSDGQVHLLPQLAATMPDDHLFRATQHAASLTRDRDGRHIIERSGVSPKFFFSNQAARAYPAGTRVLRGSRHGNLMPYVGERPGDDPSTFTGSFSGVVFKRSHPVTLPTREGASVRIPRAGRVTLTKINDSGSGFEFQISAIQLSRMTFDERNSLELHSFANILVILSSPENRTVIFPDTDGAGGRRGSRSGLTFTTNTFRVSKESIRTALGGHATRADLSKLQIDVFDLIPVGAATGSFHKENWIPFVAPRRSHNGKLEPAPTWVDAKLPPDPSPGQVDQYLDELLYGLPKEINGKQHREIQRRFDALGGDFLDHLIARLPVAHYARDYTYRTIKQHASKDHLPALLAALPNEPRVAGILRQSGWGWQQDGLPILKERLRKHTPLDFGVAWQVVTLVAQDQDPATYEDLRWHFIHADTGHTYMIKPLSACPGFPLDEAIEAAWIRARSGLGGQANDLSFHALHTGDPEALRHAIAALLKLPNDDKRARLEAAVDQPAESKLLAWLHSNFDQLEFDPARQVFFLPN